MFVNITDTGACHLNMTIWYYDNISISRDEYYSCSVRSETPRVVAYCDNPHKRKWVEIICFTFRECIFLEPFSDFFSSKKTVLDPCKNLTIWSDVCFSIKDYLQRKIPWFVKKNKPEKASAWAQVLVSRFLCCKSLKNLQQKSQRCRDCVSPLYQ